jgi:hypothetical protein
VSAAFQPALGFKLSPLAAELLIATTRGASGFGPDFCEV